MQTRKIYRVDITTPREYTDSLETFLRPLRGKIVAHGWDPISVFLREAVYEFPAHQKQFSPSTIGIMELSPNLLLGGRTVLTGPEQYYILPE